MTKAKSILVPFCVEAEGKVSLIKIMQLIGAKKGDNEVKQC